MARELSARIWSPVFRSLSKERQLFYHRVLILGVTFVVYMMYHMTRRPLSIVKSSLAHDCHNASVTNETDYSCNQPPFNTTSAINLLGILDTCFLFTYAFCMFGAGYLADRSNLRYFLTASLTACGLACIVFGLAHTFEIHAYWYFIVIQIISGIFQTTGWPATVAVVGNWFGTAKKGLIFGIWNWHTSAGNILGAVIAGAFVDFNWGLSFIVPGLICIGVAVGVFFLLIPDPSCVNLEVSFDGEDEVQAENHPPGYTLNDVEHSSAGAKQGIHKVNVDRVVDEPNGTHYDSTTRVIESDYDRDAYPRKEQAISILQAIMIPGVIEFSACLFFAKLVSYTFLYWLPLYLSEAGGFSSSNSAFISVTFDIGGCVGSLLAGLLADKTGASGLVCIGFLVLTIPSLALFNAYATESMFVLQILQFITGLFINGPYALITTAVAANLACKVPSQSAMATVSAIIDGTGSIGAAIGPSIAGFISSTDWKNVFYMTMAADMLAVLALIRIAFFQELKVLLKKYRKGS